MEVLLRPRVVVLGREKEVEVDEVELEEGLIRRGKAAFFEKRRNEAR
jgi:hypothetical protein